MEKYTEIELEKFEGKNIRVICTDGMVVEGLCTGITRAVDNTPEVADVGLITKQYPTGITSVILPEIKKVELIK